MIIQFNTDKNIDGSERHEAFFNTQIAEGLIIYASHITRIEVHLKDVNGTKDGFNDINCLLEARLEGRKPIVVSDQAETVELAVSGAIEKLKASLKTIVEKIQQH
ncbi:MAG: HPF/RaiA family ribosome-associated protein [Flavobacteriales bacterium]|nr:HPF/RaiA family ribosome-associated protein [Flavobacteriales bacterium]